MTLYEADADDWDDYDEDIEELENDIPNENWHEPSYDDDGEYCL